MSLIKCIYCTLKSGNIETWMNVHQNHYITTVLQNKHDKIICIWARLINRYTNDCRKNLLNIWIRRDDFIQKNWYKWIITKLTIELYYTKIIVIESCVVQLDLFNRHTNYCGKYSIKFWINNAYDIQMNWNI